MTEIGSAIFNADHGCLAKEVLALDEAGIDFFHWDVFDGHFIPDLGFPPRTLQAVRGCTKKPFEVHLGALEPDRFFKPLAQAGADKIFLPVEPVNLLFEGIEQIRQLEMKPGISLALGTPIQQVMDVLAFVERVLILTRAYGETVLEARFMPIAIKKIRTLRTVRDTNGWSFSIEAAGGLSISKAKLIIQAGADAVSFGGALYKNKSSVDALHEIRSALEV